MKFGQKHITWETSFLKKLYIKCGEGTSPKSFSEKSKLSTSFDLRICKFVWKFVLFDFIVCSSQGCNISKLKCRPIAFTSYKACLKNKKRSGNSLPVSFFAWILNKTFLTFNSVNWPNFFCLITFTSWEFWKYVHCYCLFLRLWRHKFWN